MHFDTEIPSELLTFTLPLQSEVSAILHFLNKRKGTIRAGLDIGFNHPGVSRTLRELGGYWMTVEMNEGRRASSSRVLDPDTVLSAGRKGELPFEDKQFDVVVVSSSVLTGNPKEAAEMIRECHRVIKAGGHIILTVMRKKALALGQTLESHATGVASPQTGYSEAAVFQLMRDGFDVLGFRDSCRFFVQRIASLENNQRQAGVVPGSGTRILYAIAHLLDTIFLFFTKGYQLTVLGHRKGWREKRANVLSEVTPVSDAILFDPRRGKKSISSIRFK
jgi:SAM-dependent methyltransferase